MNKIKRLKSRLYDIANSLKEHPKGLGLLGLGSVGKELERLDEYSDLDFFAIVAEGSKADFISDLSWLSKLGEITWCFRNTKDGYKLLYADGIFCEFAVFEPQELSHIPFSEGEFVWKDDAIAEVLKNPVVKMPQPCIDEDYLLGELLSNLYVGLCRFRRGELCSAMRFIQVFAVDRLIGLIDLSKRNPENTFIDGFCPERRIEERHPEIAELILDCCGGARDCVASAKTMLNFLENNYQVNQHLVNEIRLLM